MTSPWIEWNGGENPVPGKMVRVRYEDGEEDRVFPSERHVWAHPHPEYRCCTIAAYRVEDGE